jgi:antitoxin MazE
MGARDSHKTDGLDLNVGRWGNSLAVRLPADLARQLGVGEGDTLHLEPGQAGAWQMSAGRKPQKLSKEELLTRLKKHLAAMPRTESVIRELRDGARY